MMRTGGGGGGEGGALESGKGSPSGRKMEADAERWGHFVGKRERVSMLQPRRCKRTTSKKASQGPGCSLVREALTVRA